MAPTDTHGYEPRVPSLHFADPTAARRIFTPARLRRGYYGCKTEFCRGLFNLYWMSDPDTRHSKAMRDHPAVAATITVNGPREPNFGIQVVGTAEEIADPRHDLAVKHYAKRNKPAPAAEDDVLQGDRWYALRPTRIELIDEERCGFQKQILTL